MRHRLWIVVVSALAVGLAGADSVSPPTPTPTPAPVVPRLLANRPTPTPSPPPVSFLQPIAVAKPNLQLDESTDVRPVSFQGRTFDRVTFGFLSRYPYTLAPDEEVAALGDQVPPAYQGQIPPAVAAMDGRAIAVHGFIVPLETEGPGLRRFVLVRDQQMCCLNIIPQMNEWIDVHMQGEARAPLLKDIPVIVYGTLRVGEHIEDGAIMSLYRMEAIGAERLATGS